MGCGLGSVLQTCRHNVTSRDCDRGGVTERGLNLFNGPCCSPEYLQDAIYHKTSAIRYVVNVSADIAALKLKHNIVSHLGTPVQFRIASSRIQWQCQRRYVNHTERAF
jgi:hypothetical protein